MTPLAPDTPSRDATPPDSSGRPPSGNGESPARRKRRRRKPERSAATLEARALQVLTALQELGRAIAVQQGLPRQAPLPVESLILPITLRLASSHPDQALVEDAARLVRELTQRLEDAVKASSAFREGRVYCFWCDAPDCAHTLPENPTDTFSGYSAIGKPEWTGFINLCIQRGDTRVDLLYDDPPEIIALVQHAHELNVRLLPSFGHGSLVFNVLGQVVAGLVPIDLNVARSSPQRVALTLQVLETRSGLEAPRLRLNVIGLSPEAILEAAAEAHPRASAERLRHTLRVTRQRIDALGRRVLRAERQGERLDLEQEVRPLLQQLKNDLERVLRINRQRTRHAHERHLQLERPTSSALNDARTAPFDRLMIDVERNTVVVLGPKGRTHIFSPEGKHVTSLLLQPGELERKSGRARWQPMAREEATAFRDRVLSAGRAQQDNGRSERPARAGGDRPVRSAGGMTGEKA